MNIDMTKFRNTWFEDDKGNILEDKFCCEPPEEAKYYHSCFPCQISHEISSYDYHPKGVIQKVLSKVPAFKKMLNKRHGNTFKDICTFHTTYGGSWSQQTIVNMVNSGDYTLEQAIWVYTSACERCMNVLIHKYAPEVNDGYEEYSDEWNKCGTVCGFCREGEK